MKSFHIFTISNIPVYFDISVVIMLGLMAFGTPIGLTNSLVIGTVVIASTLFHELSHAVIAQHFGCNVIKISMGGMGGKAEIIVSDDYTKYPMREFLISAAGPLFNLLLIVISYTLLVILPVNVVPIPLLGVLEMIFNLNLVFFAYNILPIYPLDGGKMLKSFFTIRHGNGRGLKFTWWVSASIGISLLVFGLVAQMWGVVLITIHTIYLAYSHWKDNK